MEIKIKKLDSSAIIPTHGSASAAGYDLYSTSEVIIKPQKGEKVGTGIAIMIPEGYFGGIFARSGLATKQNLRPANCVGVIDSDYRGEIIVSLYNDSDEERKIEKGERIAQLVIMPYLSVEFLEVDELEITDRNDGGFGSTGN